MTFRFPSFSLEIRFSFFAVLSLMMLLHERQTALVCFGSAMLHECGHLMLLWLFGARISALTFGAAGVVIARTDAFLLSGAQEAAASLGGVAVNLLLAVAALPLSLWLPEKTARTLLAANVGLAALNLLPVYPLDLWRALHAALESRLAPERLDRVLRRVSAVTAALFAAFTLAFEVYIGRNISLLVVCIYLLIQNLKRSSSDV